MNFLEYLCEERGKRLYVLYNTRGNYAPEYNGRVFETWAVSSEKALSNIIHRLKNDEPDRYFNDVYHNKEDYSVITKDNYNDIMAKREYIKDPEVPHIKKRPTPQQAQMDLGVFPDPTNALSQGM